MMVYAWEKVLSSFTEPKDAKGYCLFKLGFEHENYETQLEDLKMVSRATNENYENRKLN